MGTGGDLPGSVRDGEGGASRREHPLFVNEVVLISDLLVSS